MTLPWAKIIKNPTAWIDEDCYPAGFEWADPSKIRIGKVFELLDYWRQRRQSGLAPIIWNRSCEILADPDESAEPVHSRRPRSRKRTPESVPDEEDFSNELARISTSDSESHPPQRTHDEPQARKPDGTVTGSESPFIQTTPSAPPLSCESMNCSDIIQGKLIPHVASSHHDRSSDAHVSNQSNIGQLDNRGEWIISTSEL